MNEQAPMEAWKVVMLTILAVLVLAIAAIPTYARKIQEALASSANEPLQLSERSWASVEIDGRDARLHGLAPSVDESRAVEQEVAAVPGIRRVENRLELPTAVEPYEFKGVYDGVRLRMEGYMPDAKAQKAITEHAGVLFGEASVDSQVMIGVVAPDGWLDGAQIALAQLRRLNDGVVELSNNNVTLKGKTGNRVMLDSVQQQMRSLEDSGFKVTFETVAEEEVMSVCQTEFGRLLGDRNISFETGSATITPDSYALLGELLDITRDCSEFEIEVSGHTDAEGGAARNASLSLQRAEAVVNWLEDKGVDASRMVAVGYGERRPIADNSTKAGRAKNRRIEFLVRGE